MSETQTPENRTDSDNFRASFDLTDFGDPDTFRSILDFGGFEQQEPEMFENGYEWSTDRVSIHTYCNPLTGQHSDDMIDSKENGYASYIHLEGDETTVRTIYRFINNNAAHVKEASLGEWRF